jgi:hypothetical protein
LGDKHGGWRPSNILVETSRSTAALPPSFC